MRLAVTSFLLAACTTTPEPAPLEPADCAPPVVYEIDAVEMPARPFDIAADLDDDGNLDNQLGQVSRTLDALFDPEVFDLEARAAEHLTSDTSWRLTVWTCPGDQRLVALGTGDPELRGELVGPELIADGAGSRFPLGALFDPEGDGEPAFIDTLVSRVQLEEAGDELSGLVQVGLPPETTKDIIVRALAPFINEHLTAFREDVDANHDGVVTEAELHTASVTAALLAPDLSLAGERSATSFALRVHARRLP